MLNLTQNINVESRETANVTAADFEEKVLSESMTKPVIVDFWAPGCAPCAQLAPPLEKAVAQTGGAVELVKVNVAENPELASALRIQSVPTVFAFFQGRPVDGFMGARPESELSAFVEKVKNLAGAKGEDGTDTAEIEKNLEEADEHFAESDWMMAMEKYAYVLDAQPAHTDALAGIAWCLYMQGDHESVREMLSQTDMAQSAPRSEDESDDEGETQNPRLTGLSWLLSLEQDSEALAERAQDIEYTPDDPGVRYAHACALAGAGQLDTAIDSLVESLRIQPDWNDGAARKMMLSLFEAMGPVHPLTREGRRKFSAVLFS